MKNITSLALEIKNLTAGYNGKTILKNLNISLASGEIGCLIGHSACGKTTLLKAIAGIIEIAKGEINIYGKLVSSTSTHIPIEKRHVGLFFQDYALFPHMTVLKNIGFGLFNLSAKDKAQRLDFLGELFSIKDILNLYPHEISGGQQQRVALARCLAPKPSILLLDEPFSNLDPELREFLVMEIRQILKQTSTTALMVTHDQQEAFSIADKMGIMIQGLISQWATPTILYRQPVNRIVADFVGEGSILPGQMLANSFVKTEIGQLKSLTPIKNCPVDSAVEVFLRPEDIVLNSEGQYSAKVVFKIFRGCYYFYTLKLPSGIKLSASVSSLCEHAVGDIVKFNTHQNPVSIFPATILD